VIIGFGRDKGNAIRSALLVTDDKLLDKTACNVVREDFAKPWSGPMSVRAVRVQLWAD